MTTRCAWFNTLTGEQQNEDDWKVLEATCEAATDSIRESAAIFEEKESAQRNPIDRSKIISDFFMKSITNRWLLVSENTANEKTRALARKYDLREYQLSAQVNGVQEKAADKYAQCLSYGLYGTDISNASQMRLLLAGLLNYLGSNPQSFKDYYKDDDALRSIVAAIESPEKMSAQDWHALTDQLLVSQFSTDTWESLSQSCQSTLLNCANTYL